MNEYEEFKRLLRKIKNAVSTFRTENGYDVYMVVLSKNTYYGMIGFLPLYLSALYGLEMKEITDNEIHVGRKEFFQFGGLKFTWSSELDDHQWILV